MKSTEIIRVLIVDDEPAARQLIREYLQDFPSMQIIGECSHGQEAVVMINQQEPDLIFLDIQMPGLSGFQVLQQLVHIPQIIFSTAYDQYALRAFEVNALDYLLKPYTRERFSLAVNKLLLHFNKSPAPLQSLREELDRRDSLPARQESVREEPDRRESFPARLLVENGNKFIALPVEDIIRLEAEGDYTRIIIKDRSYLSNYGIGELEKRLNPDQFLRVHRSHMIQVNALRELHKDGNGGYTLLLADGSTLRASRSYADALRKLQV